MNVVEFIQRLDELREMLGDDTKVVIESKRYTCDLISVFEVASCECQNVTKPYRRGDELFWDSPPTGNTQRVIALY